MLGIARYMSGTLRVVFNSFSLRNGEGTKAQARKTQFFINGPPNTTYQSNYVLSTTETNILQMHLLIIFVFHNINSTS